MWGRERQFVAIVSIQTTQAYWSLSQSPRDKFLWAQMTLSKPDSREHIHANQGSWAVLGSEYYIKGRAGILEQLVIQMMFTLIG